MARTGLLGSGSSALGLRVLAPLTSGVLPAASGTSSAEPRTCSTSSGSSRSPGCPRYLRPPVAASGAAAFPVPALGWGWGRVAGGAAEGGASCLLRGAPSRFHPPPPQGPPNFLRASALAEHIKPVVVIPEEAPEDEEPENLIEIGTGPPAGEPAVSGAPFLPPS